AVDGWTSRTSQKRKANPLRQDVRFTRKQTQARIGGMSASQEPTLSTEPAAPAEETSSEARNTATASPIPSIPCEVVRYPFAAVMALSTYFAYHVSLQG